MATKSIQFTARCNADTVFQDIQNRLLDAILSGDADAVAHSLAGGAKINRAVDGRLLLTHAILNGEEDVAVQLIANGADIRMPPIEPDVSLPTEWTWC
jgi:hypothetical protein